VKSIRPHHFQRKKTSKFFWRGGC